MARKSLFLLLFLILALLASLFLVFRPTFFLGRASTTSSSSSSSLENSYLFASPIQAKADNHQLIRITVFLLDSQGLGLANQPVKLVTPSPLSQQPTQPFTDNYGKAVFDISSPTPGKYTISAQTNNQTLPQSVNVVFY